MEVVRYSSTYSLDSYLRLESKNNPLRLGWLNNWRSLRNFPFARLLGHPHPGHHCPSWSMGRPGSCSCRRTLNVDGTRGWLIRQPLQWLPQPLRIILMDFVKDYYFRSNRKYELRLLLAAPPPPRPRTLTQQIWLEVIQRLFPDLLRPHCWSGRHADALDLHWLRLNLRLIRPCNG